MSCQSKLNDPFGRVGRRQAKSYESLKTHLLAEGISSIEALNETQRRIKRFTWMLVAIVLCVTLLIGLAVPPWRILVAVFGGLALTWLGTTALRTQLHLKRYRRELEAEPGDQPTDASATTAKPEP